MHDIVGNQKMTIQMHETSEITYFNLQTIENVISMKKERDQCDIIK